LGKGRRWANPDRATRQKLFDVLVEYIRVNLFGQGERHYGRALVVLAWLRSEPHWVQHPGQSYVDSLYSEVCFCASHALLHPLLVLFEC